MMSLPKVTAALLWECWRFSRRWYLWILPVIIVADFGLMESGKVLPFPEWITSDRMLTYRIVAIAAFSLNFALAVCTTQLAMTIGGKSGFPLFFEFRLPVNTSLLVGVPMLYLAVVCASLYFIPMLLCRLYYGIPFPLLPGSAVLAAMVMVLLACCWSTTSTVSRVTAVTAGFLGGMQLFGWLDPIVYPRSRRGIPAILTNDIMTLTPLEYGVLALLSLLLFALAVFSIRQQRYGETPTLGLSRLLPALRRDAANQSRPTATWSPGLLLERLSDLFAWPCPVKSPLQAELWLELKRHMLPVLLTSVQGALLIPLLFSFEYTPPEDLLRFDWIFPATVFMSGIGIAVFKRRETTGGYMSAFEASRAIDTLPLALLQMLTVAISVLLGMLIVCTSLFLSSSLLDEPGSLGKLLQSLVATWQQGSPLQLACGIFMLLACYLCAVLLFFCVQICSVIWGRIFPYSMGAVGIYGVFFTVLLINQNIEIDTIKQHMWGFAIVVLAVTLLALGRALQWQLLSLRAGLAILLCWGMFVACSIYLLSQWGIKLPDQAAELLALNTALLLMPLTLFMLLLWGYDRLRHR